MIEQNKKLVRRTFEEISNQRDFTVLSELIARDFIGHSLLEEIHAPAANAWRAVGRGGIVI